MLGESHRGYLLEHLVTKLRFLQQLRQAAQQPAQQATSDAASAADTSLHTARRYPLPPLQLIALSATLPNIDLLCQCMQASYYGQKALSITQSASALLQCPHACKHPRLLSPHFPPLFYAAPSHSLFSAFLLPFSCVLHSLRDARSSGCVERVFRVACAPEQLGVGSSRCALPVRRRRPPLQDDLSSGVVPSAARPRPVML